MASIKTGLNPDRKYNPFDAGIHPRLTYFPNGIDRMIASDGVSGFEAGIDPPAAVATFSANINGALDQGGTYYFKYVYRDHIRGIIGNDSGASAAMTAGGSASTDGIQITIPANTAVQGRVTHVEVYRTLGGGTTYFYDGRKAYTGSEITYDSTVADGSLGSAISSDNGIPKARPYGINVGDCVILAGSITYNTGTVTVAASTTITGAGTAWTKAMAGKVFRVPAVGSIDYTMVSVNVSAQTAVITPTYADATGAGKSYTISDDPLRWENSRVTSAGVILRESFPTDNWDTMQGGDGEKIAGLGRIAESTALFHTNKSTWYSNKESANIWSKTLKLHDGVGMAAGAFMTGVTDPKTGDRFWFSNGLDFVRSTGSQIFNLSGPFIHNILNESHVGTHRNLRIDLSKISDMHSIFYPARNWCMNFVTIPGETYPRMCLICNCDVNGRVPLPPADPGPSPWMLWILGVNATCSYLKPDSDGIERPMIADDLGYRYQLDSGENDSVASGTTTGNPTSTPSATVLTDTGAAFLTTGDGLKGVRIRTYNATTWALENDVVIASNTGTAITVAAWDATPTTSSIYIIGGISFDRFTKNDAFGFPAKAKKKRNLYFTTKKASSSRNLIIRNYVDNSATAELSGGQAIDVSAGTTHEVGLGSRGKHHQTRFSNFYADQPIEIGDYTDELTSKGKV